MILLKEKAEHYAAQDSKEATLLIKLRKKLMMFVRNSQFVRAK